MWKEGLPRIMPVNGIMQMNLLFQAFYSFTSQVGLVGLDENMYVTQVQQNPFENEIIINVPVAIGIMNSGFLWPVEAWKSLQVAIY
jgi:hypothetical protein